MRGVGLWGTSLRAGPTSTGDVIEGLRADQISEFSTLPMPKDGDLAIPPTEGNIVASRVLDSGVQILGTGNTVADDYVHDVGWMGSYTPGIEDNGGDQTITHNTVRRTGRASIDVAWQINGSGSATAGPSPRTRFSPARPPAIRASP